MSKRVEFSFTEKDGTVTHLGTGTVSDDGNDISFEIEANPADPAKPDSGYHLPGMPRNE